MRQMRAAIAWLHRHGAEHGIDPERLFVGGHSAGGQLTGAWWRAAGARRFGLPEDTIKGAMPVSGVFDLEPITKSFVNEWMGLDDARVRAISPIHHLPPQACKMVVAWGETRRAALRTSRTTCSPPGAAPVLRPGDRNPGEEPLRHHARLVRRCLDHDRDLRCPGFVPLNAGISRRRYGCDYEDHQARPHRPRRLAHLPRLHELWRTRPRPAPLDARRSRHAALHQEGARPRHQLLRHRQRLFRRQQRRDRRPGARRVRAARRDRARDQGQRPHAPRAERRGPVEEVDLRRDRCQPEAAGHRLRRPLPDPSLGPDACRSRRRSRR